MATVTFDAFVTKAQLGMTKAFRTMTLQLHRNIVDGTPRDTGVLKNSWYYGKRVGSRKPEAAYYAIGQEKKLLMETAHASMSVEAKDDVFIYSNMEYAIYVEEGRQGVPPVRMVAKAISMMKAKKSI